MPAKQLCYEREAREKIMQGVKKLARAVKTTLGPRGRTAVLDKGFGSPNITKDGVTVAEDIELVDKYENLGARLLREAASKTNDDAGDGTTTATVLAEAMATEGMKRVTSGVDAMALRRGLNKAADAMVEALQKESRPVEESKDIEAIGSIAANNVREIGKLIAHAMDEVGPTGVVTVEEGRGMESTVSVVEGMQFDRGYLSPQFVTDEDEMEAVLEDCQVLVYEKKINSAAGLVPLLERVADQDKPLLIISEDVEDEALATLAVNNARGVVNVCAVKAPGYGDRRKAMMEDIAVLTGARPIFESLGVDLENVSMDDLGQAGKITVTDDDTTIVDGAGSESDLSARCAQIQREIAESTSDYDQEKLEERLAKLSGGVAQINVGATSETEMKEKKARVEDALNATQAAVEEGILPGGGIAELRTSDILDDLDLPGDEAAAIDVMKKALRSPLLSIAANAGEEGEVVIRKVLNNDDYEYGYDAQSMEYCDLIEHGVVDPAKVIRCALENAASVAGIILTTECVITDLPGEEDEQGPGAGGPGGGMPGGGMGGMGGGMPGMGGMGGGMPGGMGGMM
ncbi:MAG: chaperonin GroEL [Planctomycetota bacterium]